MVTEVKPLQSEKAKAPIEVTELGMVTEVKPLQPEKALLPIEVTELGMITEVNVHPQKA
jgi:metal-sulfur cluster biosynthetic enzyme